ncbi:MAG: Asp-tRNA(Asn)/Glu-tRNA(Gln) amidotransferase subunit GatC [Thiotrichaceae bacterium]|nr:Asp-tRNA(Asn)/Glu-tRNA(Gln) amidotransferase subunit GatC [Thiotrichaceae bacterium]
MSVDRSDITKVARLARLKIDEADVPQYVDNLSNILGLVEQMSAVNTDDVVPMAHPLDAAQRLRADEVSDTNQRDKFQALAPQVESGLYLVPKVIE